MGPGQNSNPSYKHIYAGDDGAKFLRGEPARAVCGFMATGQGTPSDEWCVECRTSAGLAPVVEHW